jgi:hypothetical protein
LWEIENVVGKTGLEETNTLSTKVAKGKAQGMKTLRQVSVAHSVSVTTKQCAGVDESAELLTVTALPLQFTRTRIHRDSSTFAIYQYRNTQGQLYLCHLPVQEYTGTALPLPFTSTGIHRDSFTFAIYQYRDI